MTFKQIYLRYLNLTVVCLSLFINPGCAFGEKKTKPGQVIGQGSKEGITQVELQQDLERFVSRFSAEVSEAFVPLLAVEDPKIRVRALRQFLSYQSSALDIAMGPTPEANLLDMIVFIRLDLEVIDDYWIPKIYRDRGKPLRQAFVENEEDLWKIASKVMNENQKDALIKLIDAWRNDHPNMIQVARIRLSEFSTFSGAAAKQRADEAGGLLSSVKSATIVGDQGILLGEKALYLSQRMPYLLRLHARLATYDLGTDLNDQMTKAEGLGDQVMGMQPLVKDLSLLTDKANSLMRETYELADLFVDQDQRSRGPAGEKEGKPRLSFRYEKFKDTLDTTERITNNSADIIRNLNTVAPGGVNDVFSALDGFLLRIMCYALLLGLGWSIFFWGGYYVVKHRHPK